MSFFLKPIITCHMNLIFVRYLITARGYIYKATYSRSSVCKRFLYGIRYTLTISGCQKLCDYSRNLPLHIVCCKPGFLLPFWIEEPGVQIFQSLTAFFVFHPGVPTGSDLNIKPLDFVTPYNLPKSNCQQFMQLHAREIFLRS
jgi:hypothetical protein